MQFSDFLTSHPLYSKCQVDSGCQYPYEAFPPIRAFCRKCSSMETFSYVRYESQARVHPHPPIVQQGQIAELIYACAACQSRQLSPIVKDMDSHYFYLVVFHDQSTATKVGQYPPLDISIGKELQSALGEHAGDYKKGRICESQGYGIGAYAYYRRIVEQAIDKLLNQIHELLDDEEKLTYEQALRQVQENGSAKDKIALVKDLLPKFLCQGGMNPLAILHAKLSEGLHGESDEVCLVAATDIREILVTLVEKIGGTQQAVESDRRFTQSMRRLMDKEIQRK